MSLDESDDVLSFVELVLPEDVVKTCQELDIDCVAQFTAVNQEEGTCSEIILHKQDDRSIRLSVKVTAVNGRDRKTGSDEEEVRSSPAPAANQSYDEADEMLLDEPSRRRKTKGGKSYLRMERSQRFRKRNTLRDSAEKVPVDRHEKEDSSHQVDSGDGRLKQYPKRANRYSGAESPVKKRKMVSDLKEDSGGDSDTNMGDNKHNTGSPSGKSSLKSRRLRGSPVADKKKSTLVSSKSNYLSLMQTGSRKFAAGSSGKLPLEKKDGRRPLDGVRSKESVSDEYNSEDDDAQGSQEEDPESVRERRNLAEKSPGGVGLRVRGKGAVWEQQQQSRIDDSAEQIDAEDGEEIISEEESGEDDDTRYVENGQVKKVKTRRSSDTITKLRSVLQAVSRNQKHSSENGTEEQPLTTRSGKKLTSYKKVGIVEPPEPELDELEQNVVMPADSHTTDRRAKSDLSPIVKVSKLNKKMIEDKEWVSEQIKKMDGKEDKDKKMLNEPEAPDLGPPMLVHKDVKEIGTLQKIPVRSPNKDEPNIPLKKPSPSELSTAIRVHSGQREMSEMKSVTRPDLTKSTGGRHMYQVIDSIKKGHGLQDAYRKSKTPSVVAPVMGHSTPKVVQTPRMQRHGMQSHEQEMMDESDEMPDITMEEEEDEEEDEEEEEEGGESKPSTIIKIVVQKHQRNRYYPGGMKNTFRMKNRVKLAECKWCRRRFVNYSYLFRHVRRAHLEHEDIHLYLEEIRPLMRVPCPICGKYISSVSNMNTHMKQRHGSAKTRIVCSECEMTFKSKSALRNHLLAFHPGNSGRAKLFLPPKPHIRENKPIALPVKATPERKEMTQKTDAGSSVVMVRPTNVRPTNQQESSAKNLCNFCQKRFDSKDSLIRHIESVHRKTHIVKYRCTFCQQIFMDRKKMVEHVQVVHLENLPFPCPICKTSFGKHELMLKHLYEKHKVICEDNEHLADQTASKNVDSETAEEEKSNEPTDSKEKGEEKITPAVIASLYKEMAENNAAFKGTDLDNFESLEELATDVPDEGTSDKPEVTSKETSCDTGDASSETTHLRASADDSSVETSVDAKIEDEIKEEKLEVSPNREITHSKQEKPDPSESIIENVTNIQENAKCSDMNESEEHNSQQISETSLTGQEDISDLHCPDAPVKEVKDAADNDLDKDNVTEQCRIEVVKNDPDDQKMLKSDATDVSDVKEETTKSAIIDTKTEKAETDSAIIDRKADSEARETMDSNVCDCVDKSSTHIKSQISVDNVKNESETIKTITPPITGDEVRNAAALPEDGKEQVPACDSITEDSEKTETVDNIILGDKDRKDKE